MSIQVEFFGIPRQRAGVASATVAGDSLRQVLAELATRFPALAETCLLPSRLRPGYLANLNGQRFLSDPDTPLQSGDALLILSADAGG
ncbi:MAG: MoaD/ThiS family protein [Pirellulales bacterium]